MIYIVEDDVQMGHALAINLKLLGLEWQLLPEAISAQHAFDRIAYSAPRLVLLNSDLKAFDFWQLLHQLTVHPETSRTPLVAYGNLDHGQAASAHNAGVRAYYHRARTSAEGICDNVKKIINNLNKVNEIR